MNWLDRWREAMGLTEPAPPPVDLSTKDPRGWFEWLAKARDRYAARGADDQKSGDGIEWCEQRLAQENKRHLTDYSAWYADRMQAIMGGWEFIDATPNDEEEDES